MLHQKKRGNFTKKKNFFWIFFLIIAFCFVFVLIIKPSKITNKNVWNKKESLNVVLNTNPVIFFSINANEKKIIIIKFPNSNYEETAGGYGKYKINSLWKLGQIENKDGLILAKTIQSVLGAPVDAWFGEEKEWEVKSITNNSILSQLKQSSNFNSLLNIINKTTFSKNLKTNLSFIDILNIWLTVKEIRSDKIFYIDLDNNYFTSNIVLPDKTIVKNLDKNRLDAVIKNHLSDKNIEKDGFSVEIRNGTKIPGLALKFSRLLSLLGSQVVKINNTTTYKKSVCYAGNDSIDSYTINKIKKIINCKVNKIVSKDAEIIIILGEDIKENF